MTNKTIEQYKRDVKYLEAEIEDLRGALADKSEFLMNCQADMDKLRAQLEKAKIEISVGSKLLHSQLEATLNAAVAAAQEKAAFKDSERYRI